MCNKVMHCIYMAYHWWFVREWTAALFTCEHSTISRCIGRRRTMFWISVVSTQHFHYFFFRRRFVSLNDLFSVRILFGHIRTASSDTFTLPLFGALTWTSSLAFYTFRFFIILKGEVPQIRTSPLSARAMYSRYFLVPVSQSGTVSICSVSIYLKKRKQ